MNADQPETPRQAPLGQLERSLIDEFVRNQGYDPLRLAELPEAVRDQLLTQASIYASARMAEVESRSHFVHEIQEGTPHLAKTGLE